jgi:hypothetical protein
MNGLGIVSETRILLLHHKPCTLYCISIDKGEVLMCVSIACMIHPIVIHTPFNQVRLGFLQINIRGMLISNNCCTWLQMFFHKRIKVLSPSILDIVDDHNLSCSANHPKDPLEYRMFPSSISSDSRRLGFIYLHHSTAS